MLTLAVRAAETITRREAADTLIPGRPGNPTIASITGFSTNPSANFLGNSLGTFSGYGTIATSSCNFGSSGSGSVLSVAQSPASPPSVNMSSGDTKQLTVNVNGPPSLSVSTSFSGTTTSNNPDSGCAGSLNIPGGSGTIGSGGSVAITSNVTVSNPNKCGSPSGIFGSVVASASGVKSSNSTAYDVPPQVLIQMMQQEAGGTGNNTLMQGLGDVAQNRIHSSTFNNVPPGSNTNYQNTIVSGQFTMSSTTTGIAPELALSVNVFVGSPGRFCDALAFWTPTSTQWTTVQNAINHPSTTFPSGTGAPTFSGWSTSNQQILYVSTVGTQGNGAPNFLFLDYRSSTQTAAIAASCSP